MLVLRLDMARRSPLRTGGVVEVYYTGDEKELAQVRKEMPGVAVMGALTNTVVSDSVAKMISTKQMNGWAFVGANQVRVRCGMMMPTLVRDLAKRGYGGFEYLVSVPGTVGGGVFMNAGRGRGMPSIGERLASVRVMGTSGKVYELGGRAMDWSYRRCGMLHDESGLVVLSVVLNVEVCGVDSALERVAERMRYVAERQDRGRPNVGSVFMDFPKVSSNGLLEGGMKFSQKTRSWIVNEGKGTAENFAVLVERAKNLHAAANFAVPREEVKYLW